MSDETRVLAEAQPSDDSEEYRRGYAAGYAQATETILPRGAVFALVPTATLEALERVRDAAVAMSMLWFTDNAPDGSQHLRKAMLDLRAALEGSPT